MTRLGLAVSGTELRLARVQRLGSRVRIRDAVRVEGEGSLDGALRRASEHLAPGRRTAVAVAPPAAEVWLKRLSLPPLSRADRIRMLETEAERFFPVRGESIRADAPGEGPVAAVRADTIEALVARVEETVGPVHAVEPAPRSAVRAWSTLHPSLKRRSYALVSRDGHWWDVSIARGSTLLGHARLLGPEPGEVAGVITSAFRETDAVPCVLLALEEGESCTALAAALKSHIAGAEVIQLAELAPGVPADFAVAVGLALTPSGGLLPRAHHERVQRRTRRRTTGWLVAAALSASLFLAVGPWSRNQSASVLETEMSALAPRADTAAVLLERAHRTATTLAYTDSLAATRSNWVGTLEELARRLPPGAHLTQFDGNATEGALRIRGYAGRALAIVPLLERSPRFREVELTEPITRRSIGGVELESFSIRLVLQ